MGRRGVMLRAAFHLFAKHGVQFAPLSPRDLVDDVEGLFECLEPAFVIPAKRDGGTRGVLSPVVVDHGNRSSGLDRSTCRIGLRLGNQRLLQRPIVYGIREFDNNVTAIGNDRNSGCGVWCLGLVPLA